MDFLKLALEANLPHLDKIKNLAVKSFFDQNNETVPDSNKDSNYASLAAFRENCVNFSF